LASGMGEVDAERLGFDPILCMTFGGFGKKLCVRFGQKESELLILR
jgi:hypothetical protein